MSDPCLYQTEQVEAAEHEGGVHRCLLFRYCSPDETKVVNGVRACKSCKQHVTLKSSDLATKFLDPLTVLDRTKEPTTALRGMLAGRPSFLVVGGPSANQVNLDLLRQRGIFSIAVNNMAGKARTNAFVCSDPPSKFHHGIWLDPSVMKFVPIPKMTGKRSRLREKVGDEFLPLKRAGKDFFTVADCPNIWGFARRSWLEPNETFFTDPEAAWGNHEIGVKRTGLQKTVCTMFLAIRILYYLGSRRIYLVGCDWWMNPESGGNYAFEQGRTESAVRTNNEQYQASGVWMETLQRTGVFAKFGLSIFNTYQRSGLRAFSYVPYELAIQDALTGFPKEPYDLQNWYEKQE